jgi:hypothetical protein
LKTSNEVGPSVETIDLKCWGEFEEKVLGLEQLTSSKDEEGIGYQTPVFRGLRDWRWGLETTLEREFPASCSDGTVSLLSYYHKVRASAPIVTTLTEKEWPDLPELMDFKKLLENNREHWLDLFLGKQRGIYSYFIYLRHHGFPSPLLDWTASPYVAAFFAMQRAEPESEYVCVHAFLQRTLYSFGIDNHFFLVGPYVATHRRHYLQQCRYSMCVGLQGDDYVFRPHEAGMIGSRGENGKIFRFRIPVKERIGALRKLDLMNINEYSLFGTEDAMVGTIGMRECHFKGWDF